MKNPQPDDPKIFAVLKVTIPIFAIATFSMILFQNFIYLPEQGSKATELAAGRAAHPGGHRILLVEPDGQSRVFTTIQAAVDAAPAHSSVWVDHGTFSENVKIRDKNNLQLRAVASATVEGLSIENSKRVEVTGFEVDHE